MYVFISNLNPDCLYTINLDRVDPELKRWRFGFRILFLLTKSWVYVRPQTFGES